MVEPNPYWYGGRIPFEWVSFVFGSEEAGQALARTGGADIVVVPSAQADAASAEALLYGTVPRFTS